MAPCICPFADKQTLLELWGYNSIYGWWTGKGGRLRELFGGLWPPQKPLMEFQPHNSQLPLLDLIHRRSLMW